MKLQNVLEARRNPEQNPKVSTNDVVFNSKYDGGYASLTSVDKLGVNPASVYDTPYGIYAYPVEYVREMIGRDGSTDALPYAGQSQYINLFHARGNVIDVESMTSGEEEEYYGKLRAWTRTLKKPAIDKELSAIIVEARALNNPSPFKRLWSVTMRLSFEIVETFRKPDNSAPIIWNKIFRAIGIDGLVDHGKGWIHAHEPTQAVFFSIAAIGDVERHHNKYSPDTQQYARSTGARNATISTNNRAAFARLKTPEDIENYVQKTDEQILRWVRDPKMRAELLHRRPEWAAYFTGLTPIEFDSAMAQQGGVQGVIKFMSSSPTTDSLSRSLPNVVRWISANRDAQGIDVAIRKLFGFVGDSISIPDQKTLLSIAPGVFGWIARPDPRIVPFAYALYKKHGLNINTFQKHARGLGIKMPKPKDDDDYL